MGRYNGHFASKFEGCMIIGRLADEGRKRTVMCYAIPGEPEVIGLYDGVDVWVGDASTFDKATQQRLAEVHIEGAVFELELGQTRRRLNDAPGIMGKAALLSAPPRRMATTPPPRRIAAQAPQQAIKPRIRAGGTQ